MAYMPDGFQQIYSITRLHCRNIRLRSPERILTPLLERALRGAKVSHTGCPLTLIPHPLGRVDDDTLLCGIGSDRLSGGEVPDGMRKAETID